MKRAEDIIGVCQANPAASTSATDHVAQARRARRLWLKALQRGLAACWALGVLALMAGAANAATLTWDPGHTPATPSGGAGTWGPHKRQLVERHLGRGVERHHRHRRHCRVLRHGGHRDA